MNPLTWLRDWATARRLAAVRAAAAERRAVYASVCAAPIRVWLPIIVRGL